MATPEPKDADALHRQVALEGQRDAQVSDAKADPVSHPANLEAVRPDHAADAAAPEPSAPAGDGKADDSKILNDITAYLFPDTPPANDDRENVGALLKTLRAKKSRRPEIAAGIVMVFWLLICIALLRGGAQAGNGLLGSDPVITLLAVAGFVFTIFLMVGVAIRSLDVQTTLRDLTRLVVVMADGNVTDDKAINLTGEAKKQLSSLDESIERTIARASQLETVISSDRFDFERAFARTESRHRELTEKLAAERDAVIASTQQLHTTVRNSHETLSTDIDAAAGNFSRLLADTHSRLNDSMDQRAAELLRMTTEVGDKNTDRWQASVESAFLRATEQLEDRSERFANSLAKQSNEVDGQLAARLRETFELFNRQAEDVQVKSSARLEVMTRQITRLLERMDVGINERSEAINTMLAARILDIGKTFKEGRNDLSQTLEQVSDITQGLADATDRVNKAAGTQITMLNTTVVEPMKAATSAFEQMSRSFLLGLADQLTSMNQMTRHSQDASESFAKEVATFERALDASVAAFKANIASSLADAEGSFSSHAERLAETVRRPPSVSRPTRLPAAEPDAPTAPVLLAAPEPAPVPPLATPASPVESAPTAAPTPRSAGTPRSSAPDTAAAEPKSATTAKAIAPPEPAAPVLAAPVVATPVVQPEPPARGAMRLPGPPATRPTEPAAQAEQQRPADQPQAGEQARSAEAPRGAATNRDRERTTKSWLSDLLARASEDEIVAPKVAEDVRDDVPSLASISSNVDDLVSDRQLRAAWDAYRRGDENLFGKAYTERGRQIFERIRDSYASNSELRQSIQHYTSEFERLLATGHEDDMDDQALMSFLLTSPGKVYTLLAHASGRLN